MAKKCYNRKGGASMNGLTPGGKSSRSKKDIFYPPTGLGQDRNKKPVKKLSGENTSVIQKDSKGRDYALIRETTNNFFKGDTIRPANAPRVSSSKLDGKYDFIMGGDYKAVENKDSKKRATDEPRSFTIKK